MSNLEVTAKIRGWFQSGKVLTFAAAFVFCVCAAFAYDGYRQYQAVVQDASAIAKRVRESTVLRTADFLNQSRALVEKASDGSGVRDRMTLHCFDVLNEMRQARPIYTDLRVLDAHGTILCDAMSSTVGEASDSALTSDAQAAIKSGKLTIGNPVQASQSERWYSRLIFPVNGVFGKAPIAIALSIDLLKLELMSPEEKTLNNLVVGIINGNRIIVARSKDALLRIGREANSDLAKTIVRLRDSRNAERGLDYLGSDRLFSFGSIPDSDWIVYAAVDMKDVTEAALRTVLWRLVAVISLALVTLVVLLARPKLKFFSSLTQK